MATFSEMKIALDEIAQKNTRVRQLVAAARKSMVNAQTILQAMSGEYSVIGSEIDQAAIDNPNDEAYLLAKSEKDKLVKKHLPSFGLETDTFVGIER